jgi:hypothetical protein
LDQVKEVNENLFLLPFLVSQKLKTVGYASLFGGVLVGFSGIIYTLYQELAETSNSSYALIQRAVSRVQNDQRVKEREKEG